MSAIKTCGECGVLYTGGTSKCLSCYLGPLVSSPEPASAAAPHSKNERSKKPPTLKPDRQKHSKVTHADLLVDRMIQGMLTSGQPKGQASRQPTSPPRPTGKPKRDPLEARSSGNGTVCVLCGKKIRPGLLLDHKQAAHGERKIVPSPAQPHKDRWVSVVSGGLPSLGKNSR